MGWWRQNPDGTSFAEEGDLVWGDGPADVVSACIEGICADFQRTWHRDPTLEELRAGIEFELKGYAPGDAEKALTPMQVPGMLNLVPEGSDDLHA